MKALIIKLLQKTANTRLFKLYYWLSRPYQYASPFRQGQDPRTLQCIKDHFPDLVVRNGPFKGMRYSSGEAVGSSLLPKLLGSYEAELAPVMQRILQNTYTEIIDIGSAEGYYAVGFGMKFPQAKVFAFDTNVKANRLCMEMARLNGIGERLRIGNFCDAETLLAMPFGDKALIISDCEGYESELFTPAVASVLAKHDILIEIHDLLNNTITTTLREHFEKTHDITVIESIDDPKKVRTYNFPELILCDESTKLFILREWRPGTMYWFYLTPKVGKK